MGYLCYNSSMDNQYQVAQDLDSAWSNFEPDVPLQVGHSGENHPFYVERPDTVMSRLKRRLLRQSQNPPKYFLSGHRGCGKSTEMHRLAADSDIVGKYWPVHFSIRDHADLNDIDFKDVLLALGGQLYTQYRAQGKRLDPQLQKELDTWHGELEEEIATQLSGRMAGELGAEVSTLFAKISSKIRLEPKTRHIIRQILDRDVTGLIALINKVTTEILSQEKKLPLVLIDDLDKITDLDRARQIFIHQQDVLRQPNCAIVYTVSSSLFYDPIFPTARIEPIFLPNISLYERGHRQRPSGEAYILNQFVLRRMVSELITEEALGMVVNMSGGVFRELSRLMRASIDFATDANRDQIVPDDIAQAAIEIRNTYRRVLSQEQMNVLQAIYDGNDRQDPGIMAPLLQMLAILEYNGDGTWFDIHPVLFDLIQTTDQ
jgi:hypothetical protein